MAILSKPSFASGAAIIYITAGALMDVWTAVYFFTFMNDGDVESRRTAGFWLAGFFLTGLTLIFIGLALGRIGRAARQAELSPEETTVAAVQNPPVVATLAGTAPMQPAAPPVRPVVGNTRAQV